MRDLLLGIIFLLLLVLFINNYDNNRILSYHTENLNTQLDIIKIHTAHIDALTLQIERLENND